MGKYKAEFRDENDELIGEFGHREELPIHGFLHKISRYLHDNPNPEICKIVVVTKGRGE